MAFPVCSAASKVFLTMYGVSGEQNAGHAKLRNQSLGSRDLIAFFVNVRMSQQKSRLRREGAQRLRGFPVIQMIKAAFQGLAVQGDDQSFPVRSWRQQV